MAAPDSGLSKAARRAPERLRKIDINDVLDKTIQPRESPADRNGAYKVKISEPNTPIIPLEDYPEEFLVQLEKLVHYAPSLDEAKCVLLKHVECRHNNARLKDDVRLAREALLVDVEEAVEELKAKSGKVKGKRRRADSPLEEAPMAPARKKVRFSLSGDDGQDQVVCPSESLDNTVDSSERDAGLRCASRTISAARATEELLALIDEIEPAPREKRSRPLVSTVSKIAPDAQTAIDNLPNTDIEDIDAVLENVDRLKKGMREALEDWEQSCTAKTAQGILKVLEKENGFTLAEDSKKRIQARAFW
ncbi:hypothetical protein IWZ03DRAFT_424068 [Phyllosticta citriasiana]|uniref:Uncharacterized protein n=1 Tax=Phyllosticta citriasiana TaxID=595635 RepID=A0ABR1KMV2_9PEZI